MTERALLRRVNRKLAHSRERVSKLRERDRSYLYGDTYAVIDDRNVVAQTFDDLEAFARSEGVATA